MQEFAKQFLNIYDFIRPVLDFGIIAFLIYGLLYYLRGTRGANVLAGCALVLVFLSVLAEVLKFQMLSSLLDNFWGIGTTALVIIFQPELRRALAQLGSRTFAHRTRVQKETIDETVNAVRDLSQSKTGALIVFERQIGLATFKNTAVPLDAKVAAPLLRSIFYPNSPLHDGAVIINGDKIEAAHAILPLTKQYRYCSARNFGTRHRAAIGISEETDAIAVVVSEETGAISMAKRGEIKRCLSCEQLNDLLTKALIEKPSILRDDEFDSDKTEE